MKPKYQIDVEIHLEKNAFTIKEVFTIIDEYRKKYPGAEIKISELEYNDGCVWSINTVPDWKFKSEWRKREGRWIRRKYDY